MLPKRIDTRPPIEDRVIAFIVVIAIIGLCLIYKWISS